MKIIVSQELYIYGISYFPDNSVGQNAINPDTLLSNTYDGQSVIENLACKTEYLLA